MRRVVVPIAAALLALPGAAGAAPSSTKLCAAVSPAPGTATPPAADIVCGDVTIGCRDVVAVLRLRSTDPASHPATALGVQWRVRARYVGLDVEFALDRKFGWPGTYTDRLHATVAGERVPVALTDDGTTLRWSIGRSSLPAKGKGSFTDVTGVSMVLGGTADTWTAPPGRPKPAPSCRST